MGYRAMTIEILYEMHRRWKDSQRPAEIARQTGTHRATVHEYLKAFEGLELPVEAPAAQIRAALVSLIPANRKPAPAQDLLTPLGDEIKDLINRKPEPLKPKSAWEVIKARHELGNRVSYESFKRFVRTLNLSTLEHRGIIRIELEAGLECQIDYAKMGMQTNRLTGQRQTVYAFIGVLSCSRLPFVQFVHRQTKASFIASIVAMFAFWGGVTKRLNLDNLKAGVLKADLYDPDLNRSLAECADHYQFFIDPCRVASPTEKGKVERMVQTTRDMYRQISTLHPDESLEALNARALTWCRDGYGARSHGTTGVEPACAFDELEKSALLPLPDSPYEVSEWGSAKVHPDQYIRFKGRFYSLPARYIGCTVQIRQSNKMIDILLREQVIRSYTIPKGHRTYLEGDFPEDTVGMMDGSYSAHLIRRGRTEFGPAVEALLTQVLAVPANQTARRALGILDRLREHKGQPYLTEIVHMAVRRRIDQPRLLGQMLEKARKTLPPSFITPMSATGRQMIRDISYYSN